MGLKQSKCLSRQRRGFGRAAVFLLAVAAIVVSGCGRQGHGAETDSEKAADVAVLNAILAQELTTVAAYEQVLPHLHGPMLAIARSFSEQDQVHLDALTKGIRGMGGETDAEADELEPPGPHDQAEALALAYEEENAALSEAQSGVAHLQLTAPRALASALAASHAQHLAILRQGLGGGLAGAVPQAFESGDEPPPGTPAE
ncbi:MAG TPA: ferritin-like domain-containing protein [Solirubrobacterales bacterium]|nr:ferritin-like domain-containing protein [Solirubrobacterales bacterium]